MIPHVAPPVWPSNIRQGRFASTIVPNAPELNEDNSKTLLKKCTVALLGIPDDTGVELNHGRPGAKGGPAAFRAALAKYGVASPADELPTHAAFPRVFDAGDIVIGADIHETHDRVTVATSRLLDLGLLPIAIGGGHDLTFPFVRAVAKHHGPLHGTYIDAHLDVRPEVGSGMPFRALLEGRFATSLSVLGLNPLANTREHFDYFTSHGGRLINPSATPSAALEAASGSGVFVSLDMDAFDASVAPGVSALNPCGLFPRDVQGLVRRAGRSKAVRCFDIMELNPVHDIDGRTARVAAHMFLTFLRGFAERDAAAPANLFDEGHAPQASGGGA